MQRKLLFDKNMLSNENENSHSAPSCVSDNGNSKSITPTKKLVPTLASRANQLIKAVYDDVRSRFSDHPNFPHLRNTLKNIESVSSPSKLSVIARDINFNWASVNTERIQELGSLLSDLEIETDEKKRKNLEANVKRIREEITSFYDEQMTTYLNVDAKVGIIQMEKENRYDEAMSGFKDIFIVYKDVEKQKNVRRKVNPQRYSYS